MCFFLEVLFLMFHLVFMVLHSPLQTLCRCQSPMTSIYHWMYYIILGRKMPLIWIQLFFYESGCLSTSWQDPYLPSLWSSPCGPGTPWGMALVPVCLSPQPKGSPGCSQRAGTPQCGGMLFPTPTALPQLAQNLFKQVFLLKNMGKNMWCVRDTVLTQTRGLVLLDLLCFHSFWSVTLTGISIYILKDINIDFFSSERCCVAIIFSFLSTGVRILCSARHNSCSVLLDRGIKKDDFSTALISPCLNMMFLSYPPFWLLMPSF